MGLALGPRQHLFDIVQTADQTGSEIESCGPKRLAVPRCLSRIEARAQHFVQDRLEGGATLPPLLFQPDRYVVIQGKCRAHSLML